MLGQMFSFGIPLAITIPTVLEAISLKLHGIGVTLGRRPAPTPPFL